jgi:hypothetical protein
VTEALVSIQILPSLHHPLRLSCGHGVWHVCTTACLEDNRSSCYISSARRSSSAHSPNHLTSRSSGFTTDVLGCHLDHGLEHGGDDFDLSELGTLEPRAC